MQNNANKFILNRLFTRNFLSNIVSYGNDDTYRTVVQRLVSNPKGRNNGALISEIYKYMSKSYRNEYFYQNTLFNKLLLGKYSTNTTTALAQIPINKSKADFVLINGKAVVYEIKTELDSFERLEAQLRDYFRAFNQVCVFTSENQYRRILNILKNTPVGIFVLTPRNTISSKLCKEPVENNSSLNHESIFKVLRKNEYEKILQQYFGKIPVASQAFYYGKCLEEFSKIPILVAYKMAVQQLKKRNEVDSFEFKNAQYELKSLLYFSSPSKSDWKAINSFLNQKYGG